MDGWMAGWMWEGYGWAGIGCIAQKKMFSKIGELKKQRDHLKEQFFHSKKNE